MASIEPQPPTPPPPRPFQFSLRTLLLLFVVLGSSLAVFGAWGIMVFGLVVGLAIYLRLIKPLWPLVCLVATVGLVVGLQPTVSGPRVVGQRAACRNHLRRIMLALQDYHQVNGCFPPAYIADKDGKPVHSWRTLILPYLGRMDLYKEYDFNEPWDGPKNKKLLASRPYVYACPSDSNAMEERGAQTSYVAVVGPTAAWAGSKSRTAQFGFPTGLTNTIMVVEVAESGIAWTEPTDLSLDKLDTAEAALPRWVPSSNHGRGQDFFLTYDRGNGANVAMADGSVLFLPLGTRTADELREILQIGGGEAVKQEHVGAAPSRPNWPNIAALAVWLLSVGMLLAGAVRSRKARPA